MAKNTPQTAESTAPAQRRKSIGRPFKPGQSGNPKGRPPGSRNVLVESSIRDLLKVYSEDPEGLWRRLRDEAPHKFAEVISKLWPTKMEETGEDGGPVRFIVQWGKAEK